MSFFLLRKIRSKQAEYGIIGIDIMAAGIIVCMWSAKDELYHLMEQKQIGMILILILVILLGSLIVNGMKFFQSAQNGELMWE